MTNKKTLAQIREDSGKSKLAFAKALNLPYTTYLRYEEDLAHAPFAVVAKICQTLNMDISEISY